MSELDWSAWEVEDDLPESFADDVLDAVADRRATKDVVALPGGTSSSTPASGSRRRRRVALGAGLAAAAAAAVALWWVARPPSEDSPPHAVAAADHAGIEVVEESADAKWRWLDTADGLSAEQTAGRVRWTAPPGASLVVLTPAGRVSATESVFSLEVVPMPVTRNHLLAGAAVTGTVAALLILRSGEATLDNTHGSLDVSGPETSVMSDRAAPVLVSAVPASAPAPKARPPLEWAAARAEIERALQDRPQAGPDAPVAGDASPEELTEPAGTLSKHYVRETLKAELVPLARECFLGLLETHPDTTGRMELDFIVMGDASVGGIVDDMQFGPASEIEDEAFRECVSESLMSSVFDPPPGGGRVHVVYPLVFSTGEDKPIIGRTRIRHARPTIEPVP